MYQQFFVSLVESSQMTIYISCMLQISSQKKKSKKKEPGAREKKRGATLITCEFLCRCLRDPLTTFLTNHHDNMLLNTVTSPSIPFDTVEYYNIIPLEFNSSFTHQSWPMQRAPLIHTHTICRLSQLTIPI